MTREEIIDNYGFDPGNYTVRYYFHFYTIYDTDGPYNEKYRFIYTDKHKRYLTLMYHTFHKGSFYGGGICDLSYLLGYDIVIPLKEDSTNGGWLLEHTTGKYIVLCPLNYKEYFYEHSPVDMVVGRKC